MDDEPYFGWVCIHFHRAFLHRSSSVIEFTIAIKCTFISRLHLLIASIDRPKGY